MICGYDASPAALRVPSSRSARTSDLASATGRHTTRSRRLRAEAQKCVLLCSNCHAEVESAASSRLPARVGTLTRQCTNNWIGVNTPEIRGSSMAERTAVNRKVVGSSPTPGAHTGAFGSRTANEALRLLRHLEARAAAGRASVRACVPRAEGRRATTPRSSCPMASACCRALFNQTPGRREVKRLTGNNWVPVLVTDDGRWSRGRARSRHGPGSTRRRPPSAEARRGADDAAPARRSPSSRTGSSTEPVWRAGRALERPRGRRALHLLRRARGRVESDDPELIEFVRAHRAHRR